MSYIPEYDTLPPHTASVVSNHPKRKQTFQFLVRTLASILCLFYKVPVRSLSQQSDGR